MTVEELRSQVVKEALSWCETPYHVGGMMKGVAAD